MGKLITQISTLTNQEMLEQFEVFLDQQNYAQKTVRLYYRDMQTIVNIFGEGKRDVVLNCLNKADLDYLFTEQDLSQSKYVRFLSVLRVWSRFLAEAALSSNENLQAFKSTLLTFKYPQRTSITSTSQIKSSDIMGMIRTTFKVRPQTKKYRDAALILFIAGSGVSSEEIPKIQVKDFYPSIHAPSYLYLAERGLESPWIPLTCPAQKAIFLWIHAAKNQFNYSFDDDEQFVWIHIPASKKSKKVGQAFKSRAIRDAFKTISNSYNNELIISPESLRILFVTLMKQAIDLNTNIDNYREFRKQIVKSEQITANIVQSKISSSLEKNKSQMKARYRRLEFKMAELQNKGAGRMAYDIDDLKPMVEQIKKFLLSSRLRKTDRIQHSSRKNPPGRSFLIGAIFEHFPDFDKDDEIMRLFDLDAGSFTCDHHLILEMEDISISYPT